MLRGWLVNTAWMLALIALSGLIYIRAAPLDPEIWHRSDFAPGATENTFGAVRPVQGDPQAALGALADIVMATPRTRAFAGSVDEGHVSFVTRSLIFGFPDVTNIWLAPDGLHIHGGAVYGRSDLGVNRARLTGWLETFDQRG